MELVYSESCPYCRAIVRIVKALDRADEIHLTPIESLRGESLVADHHGKYVHAPHLFTDTHVFYGIKPVARKLARELPTLALRGLRDRSRYDQAPGQQTETHGSRD